MRMFVSITAILVFVALIFTMVKTTYKPSLFWKKYGYLFMALFALFTAIVTLTTNSFLVEYIFGFSALFVFFTYSGIRDYLKYKNGDVVEDTTKKQKKDWTKIEKACIVAGVLIMAFIHSRVNNLPLMLSLDNTPMSFWDYIDLTVYAVCGVAIGQSIGGRIERWLKNKKKILPENKNENNKS